MKTHRWSDLKAKKLLPDEIAEIETRADAAVLEMTLKMLRESLGMTQGQIDALAGMNPAEISRGENRGDHRLSTLRRIVEALGGELEITAVFKDRRIKLEGI